MRTNHLLLPQVELILVQMVTEGRQSDREVLVAHGDLLRQFESGGSEIPDGFNAIINQQLSSCLGRFAGNADNTELDPEAANNMRQLIQGEDLGLPHSRADPLRIVVE